MVGYSNSLLQLILAQAIAIQFLNFVRSMFKNVSYSLLLNLLAALTPLITVPVVLRGLGPAQYGTYAHAAVISNWIIAVLVASLSNYCLREYVQRKDGGQEETAKAFGELIFLQIAMSIVAVFFHALILMIFSPEQNFFAYYVFVPLTALAFLNVDWYFYAKNQVNLLFWRTFAVRITAVVAIAITVRDPDDLVLYCLIFAGSTIIANLIGFLIAVRQEKKILAGSLAQQVKKAKLFFANAGLGSISLYADQFLLGLVGSSSDVAYLSICRQVLSAAVNFPVAACRAVLPTSTVASRTADHWNHIQNLFRKYISIVLVAGAMLAIFGSSAIEIIAGDRYHIPNDVFWICGGCFVITALNVFIDTQLSVAMNLERITTVGYAATGLILLVALAILLPSFRYTGALASLFAGELMGLLVVIFCHYKYGFFASVRKNFGMPVR